MLDASVLTMIIMALPFLMAALAPNMIRQLPRFGSAILATTPLIMFVHFLRFIPEVAEGGLITGGLSWIPSLNVSFSFAIDGLSLTFALLITGIGALIVLYAGAYLNGHPKLGRFQSFLLLFLGSMLGLVLSDSFLMLFFFWELTSVSSFLLIGFDNASPRARRAAVQALVITGAGGLFLLAGLLVLWNVTGVTTFSLATLMGDDIRHSPWYILILFLMLVAAFTKSAQFPFHVWLPNAMEAPTPVSAYLHSATMVKAGVYLLMRLSPMLGDTPLWETVLPVFGGITFVFGAVVGLRQTDMKQMLAYSTVASLGLLVMLTGFGSSYSVSAAVLYLLAHALFKGALFMVAGSVDHGAGTRDVTRLSGLRKSMPVTFVAAALAALSMAGLPPFFGFLAKEEIYAALVGSNPRAWLFTGIGLLGNVFMFAIAYAVGIKPFLGKMNKTADKAHESSAALLIGPVLLSVLGIGLAIAAPVAHYYLSSPMASAIAGQFVDVTITLVPHWGIPLILSIITIVAGLVLCALIHPVRRMIVHLETELGWSLDRAFDSGIVLLVKMSVKVVQQFQNGQLKSYVTTLLFAISLAVFAPMVARSEWPDMPDFSVQPRLVEIMVFLLAVAGLASVLLARSRLVAIVSLGIQGFAVAMIFLLFAAPDLAYTQFMVETLSVVILTLVMTRLNLGVSDHRHLISRILDGALALITASGITLVLLKATQTPINTALTEFFSAYSKVLAHGANVVNVIIVDFRGTDTLGEIAVVLTAGIAILAMVRLRASNPSRLAANDPSATE